MDHPLDRRDGPDRIVGRSRPMSRVIDQIRHVASTRATVLIEGEPGTGHSLAARAIHQNGARRAEPFVAVNCANVRPWIDAELFGRDEDAGTVGGDAPKAGALELAHHGTLFLEEILELPATGQIRLLRFLQDHEFERNGGTRLKSDVRVIAGTSRDLAVAVASGAFRADLAARLGVVRIALPPLRERREDIPLLVHAFVRELDRQHRRHVTGVTPGVLERFAHHGWPGNVRELRATLEGMILFAHGRRALEISDLPSELRDATASPSIVVAVGATVEEVERQLIRATLEHTGFDKPRAAALLGIGLRTLYRKIKAYGIG